MAVNMRNELINASRVHFEAHIEKHRVNVENLLQNSRGIGEHGDILETIEKELNIIAQYHDQLEVIEKYFEKLFTTTASSQCEAAVGAGSP